LGNNLFRKLLSFRQINNCEEESSNTKLVVKKEIITKIKRNIPNHILQLLYTAGELADSLNVKIFMVGGSVRDLLLSQYISDLDLVVEGDGIQFAYALAKELKGILKRVHRRFGTAVVMTVDGLRVDVASARTEFYEHPGALPNVKFSSLKQDLFRRDFTINALAVKINRRDFGVLLDFFNGLEDIKNKKIRILHNSSFVDDPIRIFRAIRFEQRFGFTIEKQTEELLKLAVIDGFIKRLSSQRIIAELMHILEEPKPEECFNRLLKLNIFEQISPLLVWNEQFYDYFIKARESFKYLSSELNVPQISFKQLYLQIWLFKMDYQSIEKIGKMFGLSNKEIDRIGSLNSRLNYAIRKLTVSSYLPNSQIYAELSQFSFIEQIILFSIADKKEILLSRLKVYYDKFVHLKPNLNGNDLIGLGFKPGPLLGKCLVELKKNKLDDKLTSREEEIRFALEFLSQNKDGA
jgi:tRNA nucleotidyltransferase (CCA-adding enzyme)